MLYLLYGRIVFSLLPLYCVSFYFFLVFTFTFGLRIDFITVITKYKLPNSDTRVIIPNVLIAITSIIIKFIFYFSIRLEVILQLFHHNLHIDIILLV